MRKIYGRRTALKGIGASASAAAALVAVRAHAASEAAPPVEALPQGATALQELGRRLANAPRRRDFKTVPMILNDQSQWDHEALAEVIAYRGGLRQVWNNTDLGGYWLTVMRNALNAQVFSFKHPEFLVVSATHGFAGLALFDQETWDKYALTNFAGERFKTNTLIEDRPAATVDPGNYEDPHGAFSGENNSIPALQRRGVVFLCCHNAIWEYAVKLIGSGANPDKLSQEALAAELTNHLIPGAVLTPGIVATIPELQQAGFHYAA